MEQAPFKISFRPVAGEPGPGDAQGKARGWLGRLLEPDTPRVEPYAVTVMLSGSPRRRHADRDLLRAAFWTAAAHGGSVQVRCTGQPSEHVHGHIKEMEAELKAAGLGHLLENVES